MRPGLQFFFSIGTVSIIVCIYTDLKNRVESPPPLSSSGDRDRVIQETISISGRNGQPETDRRGENGKQELQKGTSRAKGLLRTTRTGSQEVQDCFGFESIDWDSVGSRRVQTVSAASVVIGWWSAGSYLWVAVGRFGPVNHVVLLPLFLVVAPPPPSLVGLTVGRTLGFVSLFCLSSFYAHISYASGEEYLVRMLMDPILSSFFFFFFVLFPVFVG
jgi:hypothetical protein